jgi:hypothetical protein
MTQGSNARRPASDQQCRRTLPVEGRGRGRDRGEGRLGWGNGRGAPRSRSQLLLERLRWWSRVSRWSGRASGSWRSLRWWTISCPRSAWRWSIGRFTKGPSRTSAGSAVERAGGPHDPRVRGAPWDRACVRVRRGSRRRGPRAGLDGILRAAGLRRRVRIALGRRGAGSAWRWVGVAPRQPALSPCGSGCATTGSCHHRVVPPTTHANWGQALTRGVVLNPDRGAAPERGVTNGTASRRPATPSGPPRQQPHS